MKMQNYINSKKELYTTILKFIEDGIESDYYSIMLNIIENRKMENKEELIELFHIVLKISKNHHRSPHFFKNIEQIFLYFKEEFKQTFSNHDLFNLFKTDKQILLFLFNEKLLNPDDYIKNFLFEKNDSKYNGYRHFFYPEIKYLIDERQKQIIEYEQSMMDSEIFENFEEKRKIGENHFYICELIRNDSIEKFVSYINQNNYSLSNKIKSSIFETNSFLIDKNPNLFEYSAFYGSIQIFQYLKLNNVELNPSLWLYAIHGKNAEIIHILEENHIEPVDKSFNECLKEAIKCHHNEIADYIQSNYFAKENILISGFENSIIDCCFRYYNYEFINNDIDINFLLLYSCKHNYYSLVNLLIKENGIDVNYKIIQYLIFNKINK